MSDDELKPGTNVRIWAGVRAMFGYPREGVIKRHIPDYPSGPVYEVEFATGELPSACLRREWLSPYEEASK